MMGLIALRCMERRVRLDAAFMGLAVWVRLVLCVPLAVQEGEVPEYIENSGSSCFYCKSQLYTTLQGVADEFIASAGASDKQVVMYNGTNADDRRDPTRLGLVAAVGHSPRTILSTRTICA